MSDTIPIHRLKEAKTHATTSLDCPSPHCSVHRTGSGSRFTDETNRPEYTTFANYNPVGALDADIRHRANVWLQFDQPLGFMDVNVSLLQRYHSALPFSAPVLSRWRNRHSAERNEFAWRYRHRIGTQRQ